MLYSNDYKNNKTNVIRTRVTNSQKEYLKKYCDLNELSMSDLVLKSLDYYIQNNSKIKEK